MFIREKIPLELLSLVYVTKNARCFISINHFNNYPTKIIFYCFPLCRINSARRGEERKGEPSEWREAENYVFFLMNVIKDNFEPLFHNWHFRVWCVWNRIWNTRRQRDCEVIWGIDLILTTSAAVEAETCWIIWPSRATVVFERRLTKLVESFLAGELLVPLSFSSFLYFFSVC